MLDGLDSINWSGLTHAYGSARDVPGLLRNLANGDRGVIDTLFTNIWHQGTVYEASAPAVPFLLEILADPDCPSRFDVLSLLRHLGTGNSYLSAHRYVKRCVSEQGLEQTQEELERERTWRWATHAAVVTGTPVYLRLLSDRDPTVRAMVPHLLSVCVEQATEIETALRRQMRAEPDAAPRASAVVELGELWARLEDRERGQESPAERTAFFVVLMRAADEPPLVRFVAALEVVRRAGTEYIDEALDLFCSTVESVAEGLAQIPGRCGNPHDAVCGALDKFPNIELRWLLNWVRHPDSRQRFKAVFSVGMFCRRWRFAPARVVPALVELLIDPDEDVCKRVARTLPSLGEARFRAVERLGALSSHPDEAVRDRARQVLTHIRDRKNEYAPENQNRPPHTRYDVPATIRLVDKKFDSRRQVDRTALADAARCMRLLGNRAVEAVPALQRCLNHQNQWVRIRAAQALWAITGNAGEILPTVLKELEGRTVEILAAELAGVMRARAAVLALQRLASADTRQVKSGTLDGWIDQDETLVAEANRALERIEIGAPPVE